MNSSSMLPAFDFFIGGIATFSTVMVPSSKRVAFLPMFSWAVMVPIVIAISPNNDSFLLINVDIFSKVTF